MKVLVVCHYFAPEVGAPQARLSELARRWSAQGADVTVLTGMPNHPTGVVHQGYRRRLVVRERVDGYDVLRTWLYATPNEGFLKKTIGHVSFMVTAVVLGVWRVPKVDVVVVSSPTFFSIFSAMVHAFRSRAPLVIEIRDLWPGVFRELGTLRNEKLLWLLERLELWCYRRAAAIVVVSAGFRDDLTSRGVRAAKVEVITNGVDLERFRSPRVTCRDVRAELGIGDDEVVAIYIGAHGISQDLGQLLDAARELPDLPLRFLLVGNGAQRSHLLERVAREGLSNVTMVESVSRDRVVDLLHAADIGLAVLRDIPIFSTFIPSKMFEYFGASLPVLGVMRGEPAEIARRGGALIVEPGDRRGLVEALRSIVQERNELAAWGRRGRAFVEAEYDRNVLADRYLDVIRDAPRGSRA